MCECCSGDVLVSTETQRDMSVDFGPVSLDKDTEPVTWMENARDLVDRLEWSVDNPLGILAAFDDKLDDISPEFEASIVADGIQVPVFVQEDYPVSEIVWTGNDYVNEFRGRLSTLRNGHHRLLVAWIYNLDVPVAEYNPSAMRYAETSRRDLPSGWPDNGGWLEQ